MPSTEPTNVELLDPEAWPVATAPEAALARVHTRARQIRIRRRVPVGVSALAVIGLAAAALTPGSTTSSLDVGPADRDVEVDREVEHDGRTVGVSAGATATDDGQLPEGSASVRDDGDQANPTVGAVHVVVNEERPTLSPLSRFFLATDPEGDADGSEACAASSNDDCLTGVEGERQHSEPSGDLIAFHAELDGQVTQLGFRMQYLDLSSDIRDNPSHRDTNVRDLEYSAAFYVDDGLETRVEMRVIRNLETGELRGSLRAWCYTQPSCSSSRHDLLTYAFDADASTVSMSASIEQINAALSEVNDVRLGRGASLRSLMASTDWSGLYPTGPVSARAPLDVTSKVESFTLGPARGKS